MSREKRGARATETTGYGEIPGLGDRIAAVADLYRTRKEAALAAGSSEDMLQAYIKGTSKVPLARVAALCLGQAVSMDWLVTGEGEMSRFGTASAPVERPSGLFEPPGPFVLVPHYKPTIRDDSNSIIEAGAVLGEFAFRADWLKSHVPTPSVNLGVFDVDGDAMEPTLRHGDKILVDMSVTTMVADGIYMLLDEGRLAVKRLQRIIGVGLLVRNDNPSYSDYEVPQSRLEAVRIVARVRHLLGRTI